MIQPILSLSDRKRASKQRFCLRVIAVIPVERSEAVQGRGYVAVVQPEYLLVECQGTFASENSRPGLARAREQYRLPEEPRRLSELTILLRGRSNLVDARLVSAAVLRRFERPDHERDYIAGFRNEQYRLGTVRAVRAVDREHGLSVRIEQDHLNVNALLLDRRVEQLAWLEPDRVAVRRAASDLALDWLADFERDGVVCGRAIRCSRLRAHRKHEQKDAEYRCDEHEDLALSWHGGSSSMSRRRGNVA